MKIDRANVRNLYSTGLSGGQVATQLNISRSYVLRICIGIIRARRPAIVRVAKLRPPPTSKHWRSCRAVARRMMQHMLKRKLLSSEHVHHKDKDFTNNVYANLEVLTASEHSKLHHPKNPIPRHRIPERIKWLQEYRKKKMVSALCCICNTQFMRDYYYHTKTCSAKCKTIASWQTKARLKNLDVK